MFRALTVCVLIVSAAVAADKDADSKAMQGTWVIETARLAGRDHTEDFAGMKLIIEGEKYTVDFGKNTDKGTFTLDPAKTPKQIDIKSAEGPFKGMTLPGIYELKGDKLTLCLEGDGKADKRPTKFEAPEMTRNMLLSYKREKK
ncbi:MAG TPA: TIGR03067 domain-containing protein [Gemmataceae bacterium]|nr:TIGR03067 domain-containing protein [Gemmataceae bacterium]